MVPGLLAPSGRYSLLYAFPSYASHERSTKTEGYTRGGTWGACTMTIDAEEIDWSFGVHWTVDMCGLQ